MPPVDTLPFQSELPENYKDPVNSTGKFNILQEASDQVKSAVAGIGSGAIHIFEGPAVVGASLLDLGLGTDTASKVEHMFQNINVFDETAKSRTIGKLVDTFVNLAIPEGEAFKLASTLTEEAFLAKKAGTYVNLNNKVLSDATKLSETANLTKFGKTTKDLTDAERIASFGAGVFGSGIAGGVMVGNVKDVGTIGDRLGGPTQLNRDEDATPGQELLNRIKFGSESALFNGILGSTSSVINKLRDRNWMANPASKLDEFFFKRIVYPLRPGGAETPALFDLTSKLKFRIGADSEEVQGIYQSSEKNVMDILNKQTPIQQKETLKDLNELFLSGKPIENEKGIINFGEMDIARQEQIIQRLKNLNASPEDIAAVLEKMNLGRNKFNDMLNLIDKENFNSSDFEKFKGFLKNDFQNYMGTTYQIFQPKNLLPMFNWKPAEDTVNNLKNFFRDTAAKKNVFLTDNELNYYIDKLVVPSQSARTVDPQLSLPSFMIKDNPILEELAAGNKKITLSKLQESIPGFSNQQKEIFESYLGKTQNPFLSMIKGTVALSETLNRNKFYQELIDLPNTQKQEILTKFRQQGITPTPEQLAEQLSKNNVKPIMYDNAQQAAEAYNVGLDKVSTVKFPNSGISEAPITNPIEGKYTLKDIAESLGTSFAQNPNWSTLNKIYNTFVVLPKYAFQQAATVFNPFTQARQISSNIEFLTNSGIIPTVDLFQRAIKFMSDPNTRRILSENGLQNASVLMGDIKNLQRNLIGSTGNATEEINFNQLLNNFNKKIASVSTKAGDFYAKTDTVLKTMGFLAEQERLEKAYANQIAAGMISKKEIQNEALNVIKATMQNYNMTGSGIKLLSKAPFGSFASYPSEIIRTTTNGVERAIYELNYKVTMPDGSIVQPLREIGMKRLTGTLATNLIMPTVAPVIFQQLFNVSNDELDALRKLALPKYLESSTVLPIKDKDGNYKYINYSHWNAYEMMYKPIQGVFHAIAQGKEDNKGLMGDFVNGLINSTKDMGAPFVSESMWTKTLTDLFHAKYGGEGLTEDGKQIFNPQDTLGNKFSGAMGYTFDSLNPFGIKQFTRLAKSFAPEGSEFAVDKYGNSAKAIDEVIGLSGLRPVQVDLGKSLQFKVSQFEKQNRQADQLFTRETLKGGIVTPEQITDAYINTNRALYETKSELYNNLKAAKTLDIDPTTFRNSTSRLGANQLNAIMQGNFIPFDVSKNDITAFKQISDKLGISNPYNEANSAIQNIKQQLNNIKLNQGYFPTIENPFKTDILRPSLNAIQNIISSPPTPVNTPTTQGNTTSNTINNATGNTITNPVKQNEYKTIFPFG